jgi:hypothetical protein
MKPRNVSLDGGSFGRGEVYASLADALADLDMAAELIRAAEPPTTDHVVSIGFELSRTHFKDAGRLVHVKTPGGTMFYGLGCDYLHPIYDKDGYREPGSIFYLVSRNEIVESLQRRTA